MFYLVGICQHQGCWKLHLRRLHGHSHCRVRGHRHQTAERKRLWAGGDLQLVQYNGDPLRKAFKTIGMIESVFRGVTMDVGFRRDPKDLRRQIEEDLQHELLPFIILANWGTTYVGSVDRLHSIADLATLTLPRKRYSSSVATTRSEVSFMEQTGLIPTRWIPTRLSFCFMGPASCWSKKVDTWYPPSTCDATCVDARELQLSLDGHIGPAELSPELTNHFRDVRMWLPRHLFGLAPVRAALQENVLLCRQEI